MNSQKPEIRGVPETMLQTLYARAEESMKPNHHINDEQAIALVRELDYDFSGAKKDAAMSTGVVARTILLDRMVGEFLDAHPGTVVVNIACGLDTRCFRMKGRFSRWYDLDLEETMAVRRRFFRSGDGVFQIARSAADAGWAAEVEQSAEPVLVIIEGLTMYLKQEEVLQMFDIIDRRFAAATVFAETMNPWVVRHVKEKSIEKSCAKFSWGIKNGAELAKLLPHFKSEGDHSLTEGMQEFIPVYKVLGKIGFVKNISNKISILSK